MNDLFGPLNEFERIPLVGADISYLPHIDLGNDPAEILGNLIVSIPWRAENITLWGKTFPQPRLVAWMGDQGMTYTYSGIRLSPYPWTPNLKEIKDKIETMVNTEFNSVLLNYYRDHRDSMGFHSDDERELGPQPVIASLSLGERRTLVFKHKTDKSLKPARLPLASGSLLVMKGDTQKNWTHGIEKEKGACGPRINLTFRKIFS